MFNISPVYLFWIYLYISILFIFCFGIAKCMFNITYFDNYLYTDKEKDKNELIKFYITHIIIYFLFGLIFSLAVWKEMIFKTLFVEFSLIAIKDCNFTKITGIESALISIGVGYASYIIGGIVLHYLYKLYKKYL